MAFEIITWILDLLFFEKNNYWYHQLMAPDIESIERTVHIGANLKSNRHTMALYDDYVVPTHVHSFL